MMEKMIDNYKQFMEIDTFPEFEIQYYALDCSKDYSYGAQAIFDVKTKKHTLRLPINIEVPRFLLFHELTHILDAEKYSIGEKNHDFCLHGFTEYHASQVELMVMIGAKTISMLASGIKGQPESGIEGQYASGIDDPISVGFNRAKSDKLQNAAGVFFF